MPTSLPHYGKPCRASEMKPVTLDFGRGGTIHIPEMNVHSAVYYLRWARDVKDKWQRQNPPKPYHFVSCGCYNCRKITNGSSWSYHAWGAALDLNCAHNPYQIPKNGHFISDMPLWVVKIAENYHLLWGGHFISVKDPMHFECHAYHKKPVTTLQEHDRHHKGDRRAKGDHNNPGHGKAKTTERPQAYDPTKKHSTEVVRDDDEESVWTHQN